jgi:hypothetical protein
MQFEGNEVYGQSITLDLVTVDPQVASNSQEEA